MTLAVQRPWQPRPGSYTASMRFNVGIKPERIPGVYTYDRYYTMLTSEYLVDDLGEIVRSQAFAAAVSQRLAGAGNCRCPAGAIGASTQPGKLHRIMTVNVNWPNQEQIGADRKRDCGNLDARAAPISSASSAPTRRTFA